MGKSPVPLTGGPNGHFSHELREDTRQREYGQALKRRPGLESIEHIDRRAVYKVLDPRAPRNKKITARQRGCMQAVVSGAVTLQRHLAAAGLVDSPACPFCDSGEAETEEHAFWQCPAWAHIRRRWLGADQFDLSGFPKITQSCAVVTRSVQDQQLSARVLDVMPLSGPPPPTDGQQADTHSYGRRVA